MIEKETNPQNDGTAISHKEPLFWGFGQIKFDRNFLLLLAITIIIFVVMSFLKPKVYPTSQNINSMAFQLSEVGILTIGMMFAMLIGGIDLSVNATANLAAIVSGLTMIKLMPGGLTEGPMGLYILLALIIGISIGALCGLINGILIAYVGIPAILATLGTMTLFTGLAVGITKGSAVYGFPEPFLYPGNGFFLGIPIPFIIFILLATIAFIILERTSLGFRIYMLGTNPKASKFSGVNNRSVIIKTHIITGIMSAVAGLVILSRTNSANADYGRSYVLVTILTAVLGGVAVSGGFGRIWSVVLAIFSLQQLSTGFNMLLFQFKGSNFFRDFAWGILLLLVMVINYYQSKGKQKFSFRKKPPLT